MNKQLGSTTPQNLLQKYAVTLAAAEGFCSVALGAFGAHALSSRFSDYEKDLWKTATIYLMVHSAIALFAAVSSKVSEVMLSQEIISTTGQKIPKSGDLWMLRAALFLCAGGILFSFSLYSLALTGIRGLGAITPLGGLCFLLGWISLGIGAWQRSDLKG